MAIKIMYQNSPIGSKLMKSYGMIFGVQTGLFYMLPWTQRALDKLIRLIDQEMESIGAQKMTMTCLTPAELWKKTGRWDSMGSELLKLPDRHKKMFCLGPTHEEAVTFLVSQKKLERKHLPLKLYQITRKFRDEMAPKYGLLRSREFDMKDLYTFDESVEKAEETYNSVCDAYNRLFTRLGVNFIKVEGATGVIGGTLSHEYHIPASAGQDSLFICNKCGIGVNKEVMDKDVLQTNHCKHRDCCDLKTSSGIEVGHTFLLGTKYSEPFNLHYNYVEGQKHLVEMGCFGLGVSRILQASIEHLSSDIQVVWPKLIAPYQVCIIPQKAGYKADVTWALAEQLYDQLNSIPHLRGEIVLHDKIQLSIGKRLKNMRRIGFPYAIVLGKKALEEEPLFELQSLYSNSSDMLTMPDLIDKLKNSIETIK
ncbi:probable proline--tRNA ligase, mitochondrial isoform X2 [Lingula anatina]|uniref:Probable proline--tRNA ligase, mitochondrial n=1 Tax=Lingula anatina TaxID=7574 RepID=A0A1S3HJ75_LINAN|nr:probable proline--tRNA ligase, mitochondrial isoform X2 [Lingula anatina]|eukprot:XP_013385511.1 probable proline--tRNA ligase, mitochondrial isoform X2 [Lingula anatina]